MQDVAIVSGVRTPVGKAGRAYAAVHPADLLAASLRAAVGRAGVSAHQVDQVLVGCTHQGGDQSFNIGRNGWLAAGLTESVPASTVDTQCGSSQQTVNLAAALVAAGEAEVVVAAGVESLTRVPMFSTKAVADGDPYPASQRTRYQMPHQGVAAERLSRKYGINRAASDAWAARSHQRADASWREGRFTEEIVLIEHHGHVLLERDEGIRRDSTPETLAALPPVFEPDGIVTAGSSSQLSDGSAAVVLASARACAEFSLTPLAWVRSTVTVGVDPDLMMEGPIVATAKLLKRHSLDCTDIDLFELHEAFAPVIQAWFAVHTVDPARVNVDGGAIGIGHPFGASGARQMAHLAHRLRRHGRWAIQAMCCGGGIGTGTLLEAAR